MEISKVGLKNAINGRLAFFNRINKEGQFYIDNIEDVPLGYEGDFTALCLNCNNHVKLTKRRALSSSCPICGNFDSSNEHLIAKILDDSNIKYEREYFVKYPEGSEMPYQMVDFYIPDIKLAIEHQGNQHYNKNNGHYSEEVVWRDKYKYQQLTSRGIDVQYTYENRGLIFNQLSNIFAKYHITLNRVIGSKYPPAQAELDLIRANQDKHREWFLDQLGYGIKTFDRYLKMTGLIGLEEALIYLRWENIPDDEFLGYVAHNGLAKTARKYDRTRKTVATHLHDLGYRSQTELQMERKLILEAYPDDYILELIKEHSLKGTADLLGFKQYQVEHYMYKLGYTSVKDLRQRYEGDSKNASTTTNTGE